MNAAPPSFLRITFPSPGFFLIDATTTLVVNGHVVYRGSFKQGFDWWAPMPPGPHMVRASIDTPIGISRAKTYMLEVRPYFTTLATLEYSRFWGTYGDQPARVAFVQS